GDGGAASRVEVPPLQANPPGNWDLPENPNRRIGLLCRLGGFQRAGPVAGETLRLRKTRRRHAEAREEHKRAIFHRLPSRRGTYRLTVAMFSCERLQGWAYPCRRSSSRASAWAHR